MPGQKDRATQISCVMVGYRVGPYVVLPAMASAAELSVLALQERISRKQE